MFVKLVRYAAFALLFSLDLSIAYAPQLGYALLASGEAERSRLWKKKEPLRTHPAVAAPAASGGAGAAGPDPVRLHHGHTQRTF